MKLKLILYSFFFILTCLISSAQVTTLSATVTGADGYVFAFGSVTATLVATTGNINCALYKLNNIPMGGSSAPCTVSGTMDSTGTFIINLSDDHKIFPVGTLWSISVCPPVASPCQSSLQDVYGMTLDLSAQISNSLKVTTGNSFNIPNFFADSEIINPALGSIYFSLSTQTIRQWTGLTWVNFNSNNLPSGFYSSGTFHFIQMSNSINTIFGQRATDTNCSGPWIDYRNNANNLDLFVVDCNGVVQTPEVFISGPSPQIAIPIANSSTGTTSTLLAKTISGQAQIASTSDTAIPVYPVIPSNTVNGNVVCAPGVTGNACLVLMGITSCTFDSNGVTIDHFVGASTSVGGDCTDLGAILPPGPLCIVGKAMTTTTGGNNGSILVQPFCYHS